jgi:hypothetical protein
MHGVANHGALAHAEIVVGAPDCDVPDVIPTEVFGRGIGPTAAFKISENAIATFAMQRFQMPAKAIFVVHAQLSLGLMGGRPCA